MSDHDPTAALAAQLERQLRFVREALRQPVESQAAPAALTGPQRSVLEALVREGGLSLKALSARVRLAHSTASGIVDRLEQRGLVRRVVEPDDRRQTRLVVTPQVQRFVQRAPALMRSPLVDALLRARPSERQAIVRGVETLARLMGEGDSAARQGQKARKVRDDVTG